MSSCTCRKPIVALAGLLLVLMSQSGAVPLQARATLEVVASGLSNPRGLNFGPDGALYVAEAGRGGSGPCFTNSANENVCYGPTGSITRIVLGASPSQERVVTGLPSLVSPAGSATGPDDVDFQGLGNGYVTIGLGADPTRADIVAQLEIFGKLVRFQPNGKWKIAADLAAFEALANPDGNAPDTNPYSVLALPARVVYADAGGNALNAVAANGSIQNLAVFPNRLVPFAGGQIPMQAVPTTVTLGPDGALYVAQLTGFPFPAGAARVYRVPSTGGTPEIYASDFTKIIDIAFGPDGSLYVLQISATGGPPPAGGPGSLIRLSTDGSTRTTLVPPGGGLVSPGGIAVAADGSIYVTNFAVSPAGGQVVRITP